MSRRAGAGVVVAGLVVAGALTFTLRDDGEPEASAATARASKTATIQRQDLVEREEVDGTLGYSDSREVVNRLTGIVTWTRDEGELVRTNERLFDVDGTGVFLLDGTYPAYRALEPGLQGRDVRQLERNLRELGLDKGRDMTVDGDWDDGTTAAVKRWQRRKGLERTGRIELGRVVFEPGTRRVGEVQSTSTSAAPSEGSGQEAASASTLMTTTSTRRIVTVELEATKQRLASEGAKVTLELPDGRDIDGRISAVGTVATKPSEEDATATIEIRIRLEGEARTRLDQAPVDVGFESERARDVLTVPVTALLARAGGEFAVEVHDGAQRRTVPVKTGLYTDNSVEIEGAGLRAGMTVTDSGV